jgi:hypothetical protein
VTVNNRRIFSKHDEGRFPTEKEIVDQLRSFDASDSAARPGA